MADELSWDTAISEADLGAAPTATSDNNVVDARTAVTVALSADIADGTDPYLEIEVYFWDAQASEFFPTGDMYRLQPASGNLAILASNGLYLGFVATARGTVVPTSYNLDVGTRST